MRSDRRGTSSFPFHLFLLLRPPLRPNGPLFGRIESTPAERDSSPCSCFRVAWAKIKAYAAKECCAHDCAADGQDRRRHRSELDSRHFRPCGSLVRSIAGSTRDSRKVGTCRANACTHVDVIRLRGCGIDDVNDASLHRQHSKGGIVWVLRHRRIGGYANGRGGRGRLEA